MSEVKRILKAIHFDFENPELTLTSPSQGGAASLKNEAYLFKADKAKEEDLDDSQRAILDVIGEEFSPLQKANNKTPSSSSEDVDGEENSNITKDNEDIMSENMVTREEFETLQKELAVSKAAHSIVKYKFSEEVAEGVASALASLKSDEQEAISKAFDALVATGEEAVEKAKEAKADEENDLAKKLQDEAGDDGEVEGETVEKTLAQKIEDRQNARKEAK